MIIIPSAGAVVGLVCVLSGFYGLRYEHRSLFAIFEILCLVVLAYLAERIYRAFSLSDDSFERAVAPFLMYGILGGLLVIAATIYGGLCWWNFDQGLKEVLDQEECSVKTSKAHKMSDARVGSCRCSQKEFKGNFPRVEHETCAATVLCRTNTSHSPPQAGGPPSLTRAQAKDPTSTRSPVYTSFHMFSFVTQPATAAFDLKVKWLRITPLANLFNVALGVSAVPLLSHTLDRRIKCTNKDIAILKAFDYDAGVL
ncbi:hypothetical protein BC830DRAFT_1175069 [Chytriomyces sp. MP71]|nr:hypothetical protein BC830DRAFT_1175069 [Chytriomyces sp. MP71]